MSTTEISNAVSSNFYVILKRDLGVSQFNLNKANIPAISGGVTIIGWQGIDIKEPGDKITFDPLDIEIILDRSLDVFQELYDDLIEGLDPATGILQPTKKKFQLTIVFTTNKNNATKRFIFEDAFITTFGGINLDAESENIYMPVSIEYQKYRLEES